MSFNPRDYPQNSIAGFNKHVQVLSESVNSLLNGGPAIDIPEIKTIFDDPNDLPKVGGTLDQVQERIQSVEDSTKAYPKVYTAGWGFRQARLDLIKGKKEAYKEYCDTEEELDEAEGDVDKSLNIILKYVSEGDLMTRMRKGLIMGVYEGKTSPFHETRWYNRKRLGLWLSAPLDESLAQKIEALAIKCNKPIGKSFTDFLKEYGDYSDDWKVIVY